MTKITLKYRERLYFVEGMPCGGLWADLAKCLYNKNVFLLKTDLQT